MSTDTIEIVETVVVNGVSVPKLTGDPPSWNKASLLSVLQLTPDGLLLLLRESMAMRQLVQTQGTSTILSRTLIATVFYEASTRTSCSFQAAAQRLGGKTLHIDAAGGNTSSAKKGESLEDTIRCIGCYSDAIVLRHPVLGSVGRVIQQSKCQTPILNAGDGVGEHPTQALLDVFTIYDQLGLDLAPKETLTVVLLGDLKHGRTVHSLAKLLCSTKGVLWRTKLELRCCAPPSLELPDYVMEYCQGFADGGVTIESFTDLNQAVSDTTDILYVTRIQKERFESAEKYDQVRGSYIVNAQFLKHCPIHMKILHPLPRVDEIHTDVDDDPRAAYFVQMENGMYVRMALLKLVLQ